MSARRSPDIWLFTITVVLLAIGVFMVFNASYARAGQTDGDSLYYLKRQAVYAAVGLAFMLGVMQIRYWKYRRCAFVLLLLSMIGLALVFVPGLGVEINGAKRWIGIGSFTIQPSEFAKLALVIYMAAMLSSMKQDVRDWQRGLVPALLPLIPIGALIMAEPDLGTLIVLAATAIIMVYMAGARNRHLVLVLAVGIVMATVLVFSASYRRDRVLSFVDPFKYYHGTGYQVCQSLIGLGSGGVFGVGLCEGREKLFFLPAEFTDFILAVLGEEMGLIGTLAMAGLFLWLGIRGFTVAYRTKQDFGRLLAAGITVLICGQALMNMCVVTSSIPATGVPLPFISYGGSSLVLNLLCVGVLLGVSQYPGLVANYEREGNSNRGRHGGTRVSRNRNRTSSSSRPRRRTTR